jgi:integrase
MHLVELLRLRWEHIDLNGRTAHRPDTKTGEARAVDRAKRMTGQAKADDTGAKRR